MKRVEEVLAYLPVKAQGLSFACTRRERSDIIEALSEVFVSDEEGGGLWIKFADTAI